MLHRLRIVPSSDGTWELHTHSREGRPGKPVKTGINGLGNAYAELERQQQGRWVRVHGRSVLVPGPKPTSFAVGDNSPTAPAAGEQALCIAATAEGWRVGDKTVKTLAEAIRLLEDATKYLASDSNQNGHLPYTDSSGNVDRARCGAAWAALHGGYRGQKYQGPDKAAAISKLAAIYKEHDWPLPNES